MSDREPLTKQDFKYEMTSFGELVKAQSKAGTIEAIQDHEEKCHNRNMETFVPAKECSQHRSQIYEKIEKQHTNTIHNNRNNPDNGNGSGYVKVKFPDHVKQHKAAYGAGVIALIEFIIAIVYLIMSYWPK